MQYMVVFLADISKKYYLCRYNVTIKLADRWKTNTIGVTDEAINVDDIIETTNHFRAVDYIIQENDGKLTETYIKQLHFILKSGTSEERKVLLQRLTALAAHQRISGRYLPDGTGSFQGFAGEISYQIRP